jgi:precorrin-6B methylase 2
MVNEMEFSRPDTTLNRMPLVTQHALIETIALETDHDLTKRQTSSEIDLKLGFNIKKIEEMLRTKALTIDPETLIDEWGPILHNGAQTWVGLDFQILQCSYQDLRSIFQLLKPRPNDKVIDLGAGYGRIGIFLHWYYPLTSFLGIELVRERVQEAMRIYNNLDMNPNKVMIEGDLNELVTIPQGDIYFLYDFGSEEHIKKILKLLKHVNGSILIVKGRICHNIMTKDPNWGPGIKMKKIEDIHIYYL